MKLVVRVLVGWSISALLCLGAIQIPESGAGKIELQLSPAAQRNALSLQWSPAGDGFGYTIETRDALSPGGAWVPAPASVWPISSASWNEPSRVGQGARFYRVFASSSQAARGKLLSVVSLPAMTAQAVQAFYTQLGLPLVAGTGVWLDKITYETVNPFGLRTIASGLLVRPQNATNALPLVSYQHGTIMLKSEVPSALQGLERLIGIALGSSGYVTAVADGLGLGDSPGLHPYVHAESEATVAIDFLRAARTFCASNSVAFNQQLFLLGYSEGGHATMALHRELEARYTNEFPVTASAPMAGPYDLSGVMFDDFLSGRSMPNPSYLLYLVGAYQGIYHFADSLADLFVPPYDVILPPLLDGLHDTDVINHGIGSEGIKVLRPEFLDALRQNPNHPFRLALRENDVYDWTPKALMRLYHCGGDQDVIFANSQIALDTFHRRGATGIELINPIPTATHGECAPFALIAAKIWFDSLLKPASQ